MTDEQIQEIVDSGVKVFRPHPGMQEKFTRSNINTVFAGGVLNPQPKTSHILTPKGYVTLSDIKVGDEILGAFGKTQFVVHREDEGEKDCIRIVTECGRSAESALDHKWWIYRDGIGEMTAIGFELLEAWEKCKEQNRQPDMWLFWDNDGKPEKTRIVDVQDIGTREVVCVGVSAEDQLYITDDRLITKNCGKAQPLKAKVLTPFGFVTMGSLKEGDEIIDPKGGTQKVLRVYEQGVRTVWEVSTHTGSTQCCEDHLWTVIEEKTGEVMTITTKELRDRNITGDFLLPAIAPCEFEDDFSQPPLPMDPYKFGRILGLGGYKHPNVSQASKFKLSQMGMEVDCYIPENYLLSPLKQRRMLIRGIIDSSCDNVEIINGTASCLIRPSLRRSLISLVHSLGGAIKCTPAKKGADVTLALIRLPHLNAIMEVDVADEEQRHPVLTRRITSVIKTRRKVKMRCILVSGESHLYITDNFIPTHNTFAAILMVAEPSTDPNFRAAFTRRNLGNLKQGGGIVDDFRAAYGEYVSITTSDSPRVTFPSGAYVDCLHIADETPDKLTERAKGWQYDVFYMDELTSYQFSTFSIVGTRARGKGWFTGHVFGTTNPKKSHWTRKMLDWYIGLDGFIMPERDGVVRWYYQPGDTVEDIIFGDSPEEVYAQCSMKIDRQLERLGGDKWTYKDLIRTFVFYSGKMSENLSSIAKNPSYISAVAAVGGKRAQQFIEGNFNVDEDEDDFAPIPGRAAQKVFVNDECRNGAKWVTVDLADVGTDNVVALAWDGFHIEDIMIIGKSTPRMNYERIRMFATEHNIGEAHIIYDGTSASYMRDYMPDAIPYISGASSCGKYAISCSRLKDECYLRLIDVIKGGRMSISERVARAKYTHQGIAKDMTVQMEWLDECAVVRVSEDRYGKKKLANKKEMNAALGMGRSMDLLDPCAMRMYPTLQSLYGDELKDEVSEAESEEAMSSNSVDIYDDATWA